MNSTRRTVGENEVAMIEEEVITGHRSLHAAKAFAKGEVITAFSAAAFFAAPTYLTLQKDDEQHITLSPPFLQYVNHSCLPSAFFDTASMQFIALKEINEGDELTFFYPSTEWEMAQAFACGCGNNNCLGTIKGAAFLSKEILRQYRLTDFIQRKLKKQATEEA